MFVWIPEWEPWLGICLYGSLSGSPGLVYVCMDPWVGALARWISEWEGTLAWCTFKWVLVVSVFWHWWSCWHGNQFVMSLCPTSARCVGLPISHPNSYHRYNPSLHLLTCSTLSYLPNILFLILSISVLALLNIRMGSYPSLRYLVCCMWACAQTYWNLVWWICYSKLPETVPRCWLIGPSIPTCIYLWAHPRGRKSHILLQHITINCPMGEMLADWAIHSYMYIFMSSSKRQGITYCILQQITTSCPRIEMLTNWLIQSYMYIFTSPSKRQEITYSM